ncbi:symmetrical bis(5'-nucleosyl)-tetraphosphatase [Parachitinimonas caeni]|uniref:Bis(5'-nucleosyl)-tetraphosphatase, symmetrical n=1 Tax=Parachitinimonas caeni TaxID=3031301 RepID=A0ABT7DVD7_9NEIS|nr:symmetrical bis(5'-nucleosyl)-tetraphosphatase [Parachitinimonas caeni]MDK2124024.1 symmetrical bis(5'-nucleosyl)-tetraphosphatase [Parachitinimonas caeni]
MATYAIGDIQGCFRELQALVQQINFRPDQDRLYLVGDLINRGDDSLSVLRWVKQHQGSVFTVLGNHDLHLIAVHAGVGKLHKSDTLSEILEAPDCTLLIDWLRHQPLVIHTSDFLMVHAGLLPCWSVTVASELACEVEHALKAEDYRVFLQQMYGNKPTHWSNALKGEERLRLIVNAMTRMRLTTRNGGLDLSFKGELDDAPKDLCAWFDAPGRQNREHTIICGHWSALGLKLRQDLIALDTGCVWGGPLTAIRLEDRQVFQVPSYQPKANWE